MGVVSLNSISIHHCKLISIPVYVMSFVLILYTEDENSARTGHLADMNTFGVTTVPALETIKQKQS